MINWIKTEQVYGYIESSKIPKKQNIVCQCDECGLERHCSKQYHYRLMRLNGVFRCKECGKMAMAISVSNAMKKKWQDSRYRRKQSKRTHSQSLRLEAKKRAINLWKDPEYIKKFEAAFDPALAAGNLAKAGLKGAATMSGRLKEKWGGDEYQSQMAEQSRRFWCDESYRGRVIAGLKKYYSASHHLAAASERAKKLWKDSNYRENWMRSFLESMADRREEISIQSSKNWAKQSYRDKIEKNWDNKKREWMSSQCREWWDDERKREVSDAMIDRWNDAEFRAKYVAAFIKSWTPLRRKAASEWWTPKRRCEASERSRALWENPDYIEKMLAMCSRPSSLEVQFASILDDYHIEYGQQFHLGPYLFDFKIGNVLVEIQGDYWHTLAARIPKDKAKATYVARYFPQYKLLYLWEHEFYELDKVKSFVEVHFTNNTNITDFEFNELVFDDAVAFDEAKQLFENYHYKGSIGRSGSIYGVRYGGNLIAACVFTNPTRNVGGGELTRFVIHPRYQKKNLGSWFLSRASKLAVRRYGRLISFCDPNFNHNGILYLSSNWEYVGDTKPDYWYTSGDGWIMHKKTLWNRARNLCLKEREYADAFGYLKVWGLPKKKYMLNIKAE